MRVSQFFPAGGCIDFGRFRWIPTRIGETDRCRKGVPSNVGLLRIVVSIVNPTIGGTIVVQIGDQSS
jgi:hypothetical protein